MRHFRVLAIMAACAVWANGAASHAAEAQANTAGEARKILYYRNPMGLPDVSPTPKKDSMGMDYIPVYEGEEPDASRTVKMSVDKIQRTGVRSEPAEARVLVNPIHAPGTVKYDERLVTIVAVSGEGYIEELLVDTVGQTVKVGQPLFKIYSSNSQMLQVEISRRSRGGVRPDVNLQGLLTGAAATAALEWPSPASGTIIDKKALNGQRVGMGEELFRIADTSKMWVIAEVSETELPAVKKDMRAVIKLRAYPQKTIEGKVLFIYPELRAETRTARVCIQAPNADGLMKAEMYADVTFREGADGEPVVSAPESAVVDSGSRQVVFVDLGQGQFEPRDVKLGARGGGYVEVLSGVKEGETVVTSANFLIDSESNLKAALASFSKPEGAQ